MKYNFDLTFDEDNIPCFNFPDNIKQYGIDNLIEEYIIYVQEYKLNIKKQLYSINWSSINYNPKPLIAGIMMAMLGIYSERYNMGWWGLLVGIFVWMIFFKLVESKNV